VLAREGSVASAAARLGAQPTEPVAGGAESDAQDPALLAQLMGQLVGELLPCTLASYVGGLVATISAALLAVSGVAGAAGTLASLLLLVVVRAFGAVASVCGVLAARVTDDEPPLRALLRGQLCAAVVGAFGLGAALFWLMREHWGALFVAGVAGLGSALAVALGASWPLQRRLAPRDDANGSDAGLLARSLGAGFSSSWPSLLLPALAFAAVERAWGSQVAAPALLVSFVAGMLALSPFALALAGFGVLAQHTRGVVALARLEQEPKARSTRLDEASLLGRAAGGTQASLALGGGLLLGLSSLGATGGSGSPSLGSAALSILLGAALLTLFGARAAASASAGARLVTAEVERQSREVARTEGAAPSYKACVDAALGAARSASVLELVGLLLSPFLLGSLLRTSGVPGGDGALPAFGVAAVAAGLIFTLGGRATRARLGEQRQRAHAGAATPSATQAESFGDLLGVTAAASVEALAFVLALTVLCLAPLLR
jgi:Na+/H+-translocating membrane pyrophosphatase